jgi:hypothetical protein
MSILCLFFYGKVILQDRAVLIHLGHFCIAGLAHWAKDNSIFAQAIVNGCVAHEKEYIEGIDFEIINGKIVLHTEGALLSRGAGDVLVGPSAQQVTLALDVNGNGVYTNEELFAGLVFLIVPAVISNETEIRFKKQSSIKPYNYCYNN